MLQLKKPTSLLLSMMLLALPIASTAQGMMGAGPGPYGPKMDCYKAERPMMGWQNRSMPMQQPGPPAGMPMKNMMRQRHEMMREHRKTMESRLENIENLLRQMVEQQKQP